MLLKTLALVFFIGYVSSMSFPNEWFEEEIEAYHWHTYIFDRNPERTAEALNLRRKVREAINDGRLSECSLNQIFIGWDGPHPFANYELCCNKTSFAASTSFHLQNHGNLSVFIHPLTIYDMEDHVSRGAWIGESVPLDTECGCLYDVLPKRRPCPIYPDYPDEMPNSRTPIYVPLPGTEDYRNISGFNMLSGNY